MKIKNKKNHKLLYIILALIIIMSLLLACLYLLKGSLFGWQPFTSQNESTSYDLNPPTNEQKKSGDLIKEESVKNNEPHEQTPLLVTITSVQITDEQLQLRTLINSITNTGACTLTLSQKELTVTRQASIQALSNSSTCAGFNVDTKDLGRNGEWIATVIVEDNGQKSSVNKTINVDGAENE